MLCVGAATPTPSHPHLGFRNSILILCRCLMEKVFFSPSPFSQHGKTVVCSAAECMFLSYEFMKPECQLDNAGMEKRHLQAFSFPHGPFSVIPLHCLSLTSHHHFSRRGHTTQNYISSAALFSHFHGCVCRSKTLRASVLQCTQHMLFIYQSHWLVLHAQSACKQSGALFLWLRRESNTAMMGRDMSECGCISRFTVLNWQFVRIHFAWKIAFI